MGKGPTAAQKAVVARVGAKGARGTNSAPAQKAQATQLLRQARQSPAIKKGVKLANRQDRAKQIRDTGFGPGGRVHQGGGGGFDLGDLNPLDVVSDAKDVGMELLKGLDKARAVTVAGLNEGVSAIRKAGPIGEGLAATVGFPVMGGAAALGIGADLGGAKQSDPSLSRFAENVSNNAGFSETLQQQGIKIHNPILKTAVGLAGDVALDPLTYVGLPQALRHPDAVVHAFQAEEEAARIASRSALEGGDAVLAAEHAAKADRYAEAVKSIAQKQSVRGVSSDVLQEVGLPRKGYGLLGSKALPGTEPVYQVASKPLNSLRLGARKLMEKVGIDRIRGGADLELLQEIKNPATSAERVSQALHEKRMIWKGVATSEGLKADWDALRQEGMVHVRQAAKDAGIHPKALDEVLLAAREGNVKALERLGNGDALAGKYLVDESRQAIDTADRELARRGLQAGHIDDQYAMRRFTAEARDAIKKYGGKATYGHVAKFLSRKLRPNEQFFGETIREGTQADIRKQVEGIVSRTFNVGHVYETRIKTLDDIYLSRAAKQIARHDAAAELAGMSNSRIITEEAQNIEKGFLKGKSASQLQNEADLARASVPGQAQRLETAARKQAEHIAETPRAAPAAEAAAQQSEELVAKRWQKYYVKPGPKTKALFEKAQDVHVKALSDLDLARNTDAALDLLATDADHALATAQGFRGFGDAGWRGLSQSEAEAQRLREAQQWAARMGQKVKGEPGDVYRVFAQRSKAEAEMIEQNVKALGADEWAAWARSGEGQRVISDSLKHEGYQATIGHPGYSSDPGFNEVLTRVYTNLEKTNQAEIWKYYDKALNMLKGLEIMTPGFVSRNLQGGLLTNFFLAAEHGPLHMLDSKFGWKALRKASSEGPAAFDEQLGRLATKWGMDKGELGKMWDQIHLSAHQGQASREYLGSILEGGAGKYIPTRVVAHVNQKAEDFLRGSLALDIMREGGSLDHALEQIDKFHFNYTNLARWEREGVKRVIPFYVWARHNLPLQWEMMAKRPGYYSKYFAFKREMEQQDPLDDVIPPYFKEGGAIQLPLTSGGGHIFMVPDAPIKDILNPPTDWRDIAAQMSPLLKTLPELAMGEQFYKGIKINDKLTQSPGTWAWAMPLIHAIAPQEVKRVNGDWYMSGKVGYVVEQALPFMGRFRRLFPDEPKFEGKQVSAFLSTFLGLGLRTNTKDQQKVQTLIEMGDEAKRLSDRAVSTGETVYAARASKLVSIRWKQYYGESLSDYEKKLLKDQKKYLTGKFKSYDTGQTVQPYRPT